MKNEYEKKKKHKFNNDHNIKRYWSRKKKDDFYRCQSSSRLTNNSLSLSKTGHLVIVEHLLNRRSSYAFPVIENDRICFYFSIFFLFSFTEKCVSFWQWHTKNYSVFAYIAKEIYALSSHGIYMDRSTRTYEPYVYISWSMNMLFFSSLMD